MYLSTTLFEGWGEGGGGGGSLAIMTSVSTPGNVGLIFMQFDRTIDDTCMHSIKMSLIIIINLKICTS